MASFFTRTRVAVLMGGPSAEHKVSLKSGKMVLKYLDPGRYKARGIIISRKGRWPLGMAAFKKNFDIAFIAMHGEYGEDGAVQNLLETRKIKFTGSGSAASRLGMDKIAAARAFQRDGLLTPPRPLAGRFPVVIKPADRGSSLGVTIAQNSEELMAGLKTAKRYSRNIITQKFIRGREFTCGVLEINGRPRALPPTEIIPVNSAFFDYKAKYTSGASHEITPPNLTPPKIKQIQEIAEIAHDSIGARGFSRTDMIMDKNGKLFVLEINTIPGLTKTSLLPQQAEAAGIAFPKLLDIIVREAMG